MDILVFIMGAMLLHLIHHFMVWLLRRHYRYKVNSQNPDLFKPNDAHLFLEGLFILINIGYAALLPSVVYSSSPNINIIVTIAVALIILGSIQSAIDLNKKYSYFKFSGKQLKWNLAFGNPYSKTVIIELKNLICIGERENHLFFILNDRKEIKIAKPNLKILNGFGILKKRLLELGGYK